MKTTSDRVEETVLSTWRALPYPFEPPNIGALRWQAALKGCFLRATIVPAREGGFRHTFTMVPKAKP